MRTLRWLIPVTASRSGGDAAAPHLPGAVTSAFGPAATVQHTIINEKVAPSADLPWNGAGAAANGPVS